MPKLLFLLLARLPGSTDLLASVRGYHLYPPRPRGHQKTS